MNNATPLDFVFVIGSTNCYTCSIAHACTDTTTKTEVYGVLMGSIWDQIVQLVEYRLKPRPPTHM